MPSATSNPFPQDPESKESLRDLLARAIALKEAGKPSEAAPMFARVLERADGALAPRSRARLLVTLGSCLAEIGDGAGALARFGEARPLAAGDRGLEAMILANIGGLHANAGAFAEARAAMEAALPLLEAASSPADLAGCLVNLEIVAFRMGDTRAALAYADRSIVVLEKTGGADALARALGQAAALNSNLGRDDRALALSGKALAVSAGVRNRRTRAEILVNHGSYVAEFGGIDEALARVNDGLALHRESGNSEGEAFALCLLARLLRRRGKMREATDAASRALAWFESAGDARGVYAARMQLGYAAVGANDPKAAAEHFREGVRRCQSIGYVRGEATALGALADLARSMGTLADAEPWYAQAVACEERLAQGLRELPEAALRYGERTTPLVRRYVGLLHELGRTDDAFAWTQRAKARFLADAAGRTARSEGNGTGAPDRERLELEARERALTRRWLEAQGPGATTIGTRAGAALRADRNRLEADWNAYEERRRLRDRARPAAGWQGKFTCADAAALLPERTALIEYVVVSTPRGDRIVATIATAGNRSGRPPSFALAPERTAAVFRRVRELRAACATKPGKTGGVPWRAVAAELHRELIAPAAKWLGGARRLVLCPDGPLWDVPFSVLPVGGESGACLWDRYDIAIAPGAAALATARACRSRPGRVAPRGELLIVADPDPGSTAVAALPRLPYARVEAEAIHAVFPRSTTRLGAGADEAGVVSELRGYRRLHFATHAVLDETSPLLGGIVLAPGKTPVGGDGLLTAREWMGLDLAADLLVFSACGSGRGRSIAGEGVVGLAWAAFLSGVPAQVVSQWSVDDKATAELMAGFYGRLRMGVRVDAALRAAARELRSRPATAHPFYWAPFIALGDVWTSRV